MFLPSDIKQNLLIPLSSWLSSSLSSLSLSRLDILTDISGATWRWREREGRDRGPRWDRCYYSKNAKYYKEDT